MEQGIKLISLAVVALFLGQIVGGYLLWMYWLQVKEYRRDRFVSFLKSGEGKNELLIIPLIIKIFSIFAGNFVNSQFLFLYFITVVYLGLYFGTVLFKRKLRKPVMTQRTKRISLITLILTFLLVLLFYPNFWMVIIETFAVLGPLLGIFITGFSVKITKKNEMKLMIEKLQKYQPFIVGITGSYGKTTTKDFLAQLLETKYPLLSTLKNQNTHFGILRRINNDLKKEHKFFISEIGAYKKGEIKEIAQILKPKAAFITGIEPQHLELFGNFASLKDAKFELVEALVDGGMVFFNLSGKGVSDLVVKTKKLNNNIKVYSYAVDREGKFDAKAKIISIDTGGISFSISINGVAKKIRTNICSKSLIENLTGSILAARVLGVEWDRIEKKCNDLTLPEGTLNIFKTKEDFTVIDDSYNTSPSGFKAALEALDMIKGKRRYVATTGIIELGSETFSIHKSLGKMLDGVADIILLRNKSFEKPIKEGLKDKNKLVVMTDPKRMLDYLKDNLKKGDALLIEGKLPRLIDHFRSIDNLETKSEVYHQ